MHVGDSISNAIADAWTCDGIVAGDDRSDLGVRLKASVTDSSKEVTDGKITLDSCSSEYYSVTASPSSGKLTVSKYELQSVSSPEIEITYGQKISEGTLTGGKVSIKSDTPLETEVSGTFSLETASSDDIPAVGTYTDKATAKFTPDDQAKYKVLTGIPVRVAVKKKPVTVTLKDITVNQGDKLPEFSWTLSTELVGSDKIENMVTFRTEADTSRPGLLIE